MLIELRLELAEAVECERLMTEQVQVLDFAEAEAEADHWAQQAR
jgi:hypothetical protein